VVGLFCAVSGLAHTLKWGEKRKIVWIGTFTNYIYPRVEFGDEQGQRPLETHRFS